MSCKDYLELKPGMKVKLSYEPWGYKDVNAVIDSVGVDYHYDETHNCGVFHPIIACYVGKYRMTFNGPINWETLVIKPCRKVYVKDLCVGDVIERDEMRGLIEIVSNENVYIRWYDKSCKVTYYTNYRNDIIFENAEIVGHVNLWNL
jgi:hypothetical protein